MYRVQQVAVCILLAFQFSSVEAKLQQGSVSISGIEPDKQWQYISKFGYGVGAGDYSVRVRLQEKRKASRNVKLSFDVFLDEDWDAVQTLPSCRRSTEGPARRSLPVLLQNNAEWSKWVNGNVFQSVRPHIWYFALSNCDQDPRGRNTLNGTYLIDYEIRAQDGGSEFSIEMRYMFFMSVAALSVFSVFLITFAVRCFACRRTTGSVHVVVWVLTLAMLLQFAGQVIEIVHLWRFRSDGVGIQTLDTLSQVLLMMSQVVQTTLLISIALGYTLLHVSMDELALVKPITFVVCVIHAALVAVGKLHGDSHFKYHEHEGVVGWALLVLRLGLYVWFVAAIKESQQKGGFRLQAFLQQFRTAGTIYFLAYPALFVVVQVFAPYLQHPIMQTGLLTMQTASHFWLANLFLSRGNYFKASVLGASVLPGGGGFCVPPQKEA